MTNGKRRWTSRLGTLAMACTLLLAACAQATYDTSLSPAQNELRAANARFTNTVITGAATGAVLGGVAGALLAGRNNRVQGAALGAAAGGALGAGAGYAVASNNARQTRSEDAYNGAIQEAQGEADAYRRSATASASIANEAETKLRTLNAQYAAKQISADAFRAQLANYHPRPRRGPRPGAAAGLRRDRHRALQLGAAQQRGAHQPRARGLARRRVGHGR